MPADRAPSLKGGFLTRRPACFSPDGRLIYVPVSTDIRVYSALSGEHVGTLRGHQGEVTAVVLDPSAAAAAAKPPTTTATATATATATTTPTSTPTRLYSASADGTLRHWDAATGECLAVHTVAADEGVESFAISAPLGVAYCVLRHRGGQAGRVQAVALLTGEALPAGGRLKVRRGARLAVSPSGAFVAVLDRNSLFVWSAAADLADAGLIGHGLQRGGQQQPLADGANASSPPSLPPRRRVKPLNLHHTKAYTALAFDPNDGALAAGDASGRILLWHDFAAAVRGGTLGGRAGGSGGANLQQQQQQDAASDPSSAAPPCTTVHWHASAVGCLAFSADGAHLMSGGAEGVLVQWHVASGRRTYLPRLGGPLVQVLPSPADGARLLVAQADNTLRVVNSAAMRVEATVHGLRPPPAPAPAAVAAAAAAMAAAAAAANAAAQGCATAEQRNAVAAWWWRAASLVPQPWQSATATPAALHPSTGHLVLPCENAQLQFFDASCDRHVGRMQVAPRNAVAVAAAAGDGGGGAGGGGSAASGWVAQGDYANYQQHQRGGAAAAQGAPGAASAAAPGEPQVTHVAFASAGGGAMATVDVRPDTASAAAAALAAAAAASAAAEGPYDSSACAAAAAAAAAAAGGASSLRLWDLVGPGGGRGGGSGAGSGFALAACIDAPHAGAVTGLAAHPSRDVVATCSDDGEFKVWARGGDAPSSASSSWRCASVGGYKRRPLGGAAFSPDGSLLAIGAGTTATLWDPVQCRLVAALVAPPLPAPPQAGAATTTTTTPGPIVRLAFVTGAPGAPPRLVACTAAPHARVIVWDLLTASAAWSVELEATALAADPRHAGVFAVGVGPSRGSASRRQQQQQQQQQGVSNGAAADGPASPTAASSGGGKGAAALAPPTPPTAANKQQQNGAQPQPPPQPCGHVLVFDASSPVPKRACAVPGSSPPCALLFVPRDVPLAAAAAASAPRGLSPLLVLTADRRYAAVTSPGRRAAMAAAAGGAGVAPAAEPAAGVAPPRPPPPPSQPPSVLEAVFGKTPMLQSSPAGGAGGEQASFDAEGLELLAAARGAVKGLLDAPSHALPPPKAMCAAMLELLLTGGCGGGGV